MLYIVKLEKDGETTYTEFEKENEAENFAVLGVSRGWKWDIYKLTN